MCRELHEAIWNSLIERITIVLLMHMECNLVVSRRLCLTSSTPVLKTASFNWFNHCFGTWWLTKKGKHPSTHFSTATLLYGCWLCVLNPRNAHKELMTNIIIMFSYLGWFQYSIFHKIIPTFCQAVLDAKIANPSIKLSFWLEKFYDNWFREGQFHVISQLCCALILGRAPRTRSCVYKSSSWIVVWIFSGCHDVFEWKNGSVSQNVVLGVHRTNYMRRGNESKQS